MMKRRVLTHIQPGEDVETYLRTLVDELNKDEDPDPVKPIDTLAGLSDVEITSVADGEYLRYDAGTGKWVNVTLPFWGNAEFLLAAADPGLPNSRLVQDTATIKWDFSVFGFAKANVDQTALNVFTGDTGSGGLKGVVPAPSAGDAAAGKFLHADGSFKTPSLSPIVKISYVYNKNLITAPSFVNGTGYVFIHPGANILDPQASAPDPTVHRHRMDPTGLTYQTAQAAGAVLRIFYSVSLSSSGGNFTDGFSIALLQDGVVVAWKPVTARAQNVVGASVIFVLAVNGSSHTYTIMITQGSSDGSGFNNGWSERLLWIEELRN